MNPPPDPSASRHAIVAERVFDGGRWHERAAVLIEDGRIRGVGKAADVPRDWARRELAAGAVLAPECVPAGFVKSLARAGVRVSVGHSEATAEVLERAIDDGLTGVTHLFNAMPAMSAREPGIVGTALADSRLTAGLIVDGIHVDPTGVRAAFRAKGAEGIAIVTDAMPTVGSNIDRFSLMGRDITLTNGRLQLANGTLAGAHLDMAAAVRNAVQLAGVPLDQALQSASLTPAKFLGIEKERGTLSAGARGDLVALDANLQVIDTWIGGVPNADT